MSMWIVEIFRMSIDKICDCSRYNHKSGYEMTPEKLDDWVQEDVRKQLKPKKPPPKESVDPTAKKFFLSMMCQPKQKELMSDYDRSITKSWEKKRNRRYNQVPQLGE